MIEKDFPRLLLIFYYPNCSDGFFCHNVIEGLCVWLTNSPFKRCSNIGLVRVAELAEWRFFPIFSRFFFEGEESSPPRQKFESEFDVSTLNLSSEHRKLWDENPHVRQVFVTHLAANYLLMFFFSLNFPPPPLPSVPVLQHIIQLPTCPRFWKSRVFFFCGNDGGNGDAHEPCRGGFAGSFVVHYTSPSKATIGFGELDLQWHRSKPQPFFSWCPWTLENNFEMQ